MANTPHPSPVIENQVSGTGHSMGLFYKYSGPRGNPVLDYVCEVQDLNLANMTRGAAEVRTRCRVGTQALPSVADLPTVDFSHPYGYDTLIEDRLWQWFQSGQSVDWFITDNPDVIITPPGTVDGLWLPAFVSQMNWNQPLDEVSTWDIQLSNAKLIDYVTGTVDAPDEETEKKVLPVAWATLTTGP